MSGVRCFVILCGVVFLVMGPVGISAQEGPDPCDFFPWDTVDNGMGAEPGVVREFVAGMAVDPACLAGGRVFVPWIEIGLTRTAAGPSTFDLDVFIREADGSEEAVAPGPFRTPSNIQTATGVSIFPGVTIEVFPSTPPSSQNINNVLWGDYNFLGTAWSGDTASVFLAADETGPQGATLCYTGTNGATPIDNCLNGNPNLNAPAFSAQTYTFYGRYTSGAQVASDEREPLSTTWGFRYVSEPGAPSRTLRFREGRGGPTICEHPGVGGSYNGVCPMNSSQLGRLRRSGVFCEIHSRGVSEEVRIYSAEAFGFVDSFESGDASVWSSTAP
jgi:hypothetical protein